MNKMDQTVTPVNDEEENLYSYSHDGPQAYDYEPFRQDRERDQGSVRRNKGQRRTVSCRATAIVSWRLTTVR